MKYFKSKIKIVNYEVIKVGCKDFNLFINKF